MNSRTFFPSSDDEDMNFLTRSAARAGEFVGIHVLKPKNLGKEKNSDINIDCLRNAVLKHLMFWCQK